MTNNIDHIATARNALLALEGQQPTSVTQAGAGFATAHAAIAIASSLATIAGSLQQIANALRKDAVA